MSSSSTPNQAKDGKSKKSSKKRPRPMEIAAAAAKGDGTAITSGSKASSVETGAARATPSIDAAAATTARPTSPFEECKMRLQVSLLPKDMRDIYHGIRSNVYKLLMRYDDSAGGVILSFSSISFPAGREHGCIIDEMPHIHFAVNATALVFRPLPGMVLRGRVNKVSVTHVGLLVCGIFNASISAQEMGKKWSFHSGAEQWQRHGEGGEGGEGVGEVGLESVVEFSVRRLHEASGLISIEGGLKACRGLLDNEYEGADGAAAALGAWRAAGEGGESAGGQSVAVVAARRKGEPTGEEEEGPPTKRKKKDKKKKDKKEKKEHKRKK